MGRPAKNMALAAVDGAAVMSPARFKDRVEDEPDDRLLDDHLNPLLTQCAPPIELDMIEAHYWNDFIRKSFWLRASEYYMSVMAAKMIVRVLSPNFDVKDYTALTALLVKLGHCPTSRGQITMKKKNANKKTGKFY